MASNCEEVSAYFSADEDVYHVCKDCAVGKNIPPDKKITGSPGPRTLCDRCTSMRAGQPPR